jgi:tryptophanyl-tRNA synthetase
MSKPVILTGLRANGELHLGSYLGAIFPMVQMQHRLADEYQLNMFVPDLHSFTTPIDHSTLFNQTMTNLRTYAASGLDLSNENTFIYRQSFISAHSELTVLLNNFAHFGELQRMTQIKEKSDQAKVQAVTAGLFDYPVLMAADILLYGASYVPVGEDQRQHLELTRDLAIRMNNKFGNELFVIPETWDNQLAFAARHEGIRIKSLRNPDKKMSKSIEDPAGTILLSDNPDEAAKKIMSATTDSVGVIHFDVSNQPGISNLLQILSLLTGDTIGGVTSTWDGKTSYGELKTAVADQVRKLLTDFQTKLAHTDDSALLHKLEVSELLMRDVSGQRLYSVQQAVGLRAAS